MSSLRRLSLFTLLGLAGMEARARAQCSLPDGLDVQTCGTAVRPNLPRFQGFRQDALAICWEGCESREIEGATAEWTLVPVRSPGAGDPAQYFARLELSDGAGALLWQGRLRLLYSRTWLEAGGDSAIGRQVWRFLVNGDLGPSAPQGTGTGSVPPCSSAHANRVHFTGYLDQARNCASGRFESAWMLTHAIDRIAHAAGFPRAGVFHPDEAFTFVGPAAGFRVGPEAPLEESYEPSHGFESVRRLDRAPHRALPGSAWPVVYGSEEPVTSFLLTPRLELCPSGATPRAQYFLADLSLRAACGTNLQGVFLAMSLGSWTDEASYPGPQHLSWNAGSYAYTDPFAGTSRQEAFFGVTTGYGFPAFSVPGGVQLPPRFIDQVNALTSTGAAVMNVPHTSDHVLGLNLVQSPGPCADCGGTGY